MATPSLARVSNRDISVNEHAGQTLDIEAQIRSIEEKFGQIQKERKDVHALTQELDQTQANKKTDEQIMLLMQVDERLATLLSQAAESICALLPSEVNEGQSETSDGLPLRGAKAFEDRVQGWFVILNEVQYTLRSAVRHLRDAQRVPLTLPCGPEARLSGMAGSASRGHSLSLLEAFVDTSGSDGTVFKLPPLPRKTPATHSLPPSETSLSLSALRRKEKNWKRLSESLEELEKSLCQDDDPPVAQEEIVDAIRRGGNTDKLLLKALLETNGLA